MGIGGAVEFIGASSEPERRKRRRLGVAIGLACALVFVLPAAEGDAAPVVRQDAGANPSDIQDTVDQFRTDLGGVNNDVGGSFPSGRREINWDGVPDSSAQPNFLDPKFFNTTSPRGIVFNTFEAATGGGLNDFMVSADSSNPDGAAVRFGNIDASYTATFKTFSGERLFAPRNTHLMEITFFVPGTQIPATVKGFGAVFTDVDTSTASTGRSALIRAYDADGDQLISFTTSASSGGLSFGGVSMNAGERIARVTIQAGNVALASGRVDSATTDVVAMDDFIFGEPRAMQEHTADFDADGGTDIAVFRPSSGLWFRVDSGTGATHVEAWGTDGDVPVAADYDGDQRTDLAVFRPSNGLWFVKRSSGSPLTVAFGTSGDIPKPGDYDRDGKADIAVFRPSSGLHFIQRSSNGAVAIIAFGTDGDIPVPS